MHGVGKESPSATQAENDLHLGLKKKAFTDVIKQEFLSKRRSSRQMVVKWKLNLSDKFLWRVVVLPNVYLVQ